MPDVVVTEEEEEEAFFLRQTSLKCSTWCSHTHIMHYSNPADDPFSCSVMRERWSKGAGEGQCDEVQKPMQGPRSSKGTLMDPDVQVGDMKEEQVPWKSFEVVSLVCPVWRENKVCTRVCMVVYASTEADYPNSAIGNVHKANTVCFLSPKFAGQISKQNVSGVFLVEGGSGRRKHGWLLISIMQTFCLWSSITSLPC